MTKKLFKNARLTKKHKLNFRVTVKDSQMAFFLLLYLMRSAVIRKSKPTKDMEITNRNPVRFHFYSKSLHV